MPEFPLSGDVLGGISSLLQMAGLSSRAEIAIVPSELWRCRARYDVLPALQPTIASNNTEIVVYPGSTYGECGACSKILGLPAKPRSEQAFKQQT